MRILAVRRAYPETPIEEIAKRPFSQAILHEHLIGEYGEPGIKGRLTLTGRPIRKGKAHWDFRCQMLDPKKNKLLNRLEGWTATKPPSNEAGYERKILVVPKAIQPLSWLYVEGYIPIGEPGSGTHLPGYFTVLESFKAIKGDHEPNFREYFWFGKKWNGRFVVRRVKVRLAKFPEPGKIIKLKPFAYRWVMWKTKDQTRFAKLLRELKKRGRKIPNAKLLFKLYPYEGEESFSWEESYKIGEKLPDGLLIAGEAIHVGETRNRNIFTYAELLRAARTLIGAPIELDHDGGKYGEIIDAEFDEEDWCVRYLGKITDPEIIGLALSGQLKDKVSVKFKWRTRKFLDGKEIVGLRFTALSLLKDLEPGDPKTRMKILSNLLARFAPNSLQEAIYTRFFFCKKHGWIPKILAYRKEERPFCPYCRRTLRVKPRNHSKKYHSARAI